MGEVGSRFVDDACVGLSTLLVYGLTLAPTITTGDSGELVTAAATSSLAHPTGYPLYLLSGYGFIQIASWLSFGGVSAALAMNLFSALTASAACVVMRRLVDVVLGDRLVAASAALLFAFSTSMWSQATTARVYALGALLLALVLLELAQLVRRRGGSLARAWLYFGLGMANHTVMMLVAPLIVLATLRNATSWRSRGAAALACLPGLSLYAYVPIAASFEPVQDWGDPSVAERLIPYLSRESFWSKRYVDEAGDLWSVAAHYLDQIPIELGWLGMLLLIVGLASARSRRGVVAVGLYLFVANAMLVALHGSRQDIFHWSRYLISGWLGLVLVAGVGLEAVMQELRKARAPLRWSVALAAPLGALLFGYARADRSEDTWARDFANGILEGLEPGALLFAEEDNVLFPLSYLHHVEHVRPDVELVMQGVNRMESKPIAPDRQPTYFTHPRGLGSDALELLPDGLVLRLLPTGGGPTGSAFRGRAWNEVQLESFELVRTGEQGRYLDRSLVGNYYFLEALNRERSEPEAAMRAIERLRAVSFDNAVNQVNAGLLLERNLRFEAAFEAFEAAAAIDPANDLAVARATFWRATLDRAASVTDPIRRRQSIASALLQDDRVDLASLVLDTSPTAR